MNSVSELRRVQVAGRLRLRGGPHGQDAGGNSDDDDDDASSPDVATAAEMPSFPVVFELDRHCIAGHVLLVFLSPRSSGVYFMDLCGDCHFVSPTLSAYHRLLLLHIGLPHWQLAFTPAGMPQDTEQWMNFLSPQRLTIDHGGPPAANYTQAQRPHRTHTTVEKKQKSNDAGTGSSRSRGAHFLSRTARAAALLDLAQVEASAQSVLALKAAAASTPARRTGASG